MVQWRAAMPHLAWADWEIKAADIEIVLNADGSDCVLGKGAYGEVGCRLL